MPKYQPQQRIEDKFEIVAFLGEGAFSEVYKARNLLLKPQDFCVLKILNPIDERDDLLKAFWTESEILRDLGRHRHIARFYNASKFTNSGELYIELEYVEGPTLAALLKENSGRIPPLPLATARQAGLDLLDALTFLHEQPQPILHRDINPNNLILNPERGLVIIDFNVSKMLVRGASPPQTRVGTPPYVPPEIEPQEAALAGNWSIQSDLYSAGVVLYQMLSGQNDPFLSKTDRPRGKSPRPLSDYYPQLPQAVETIIMKAVAYDPAGRYASAREMREAILADWPENESEPAMTAPLPEIIPAEPQRPPVDVETLLRQAQALLDDDGQFDEGRIGVLLDQAHEADPQNPEVPKLREKAAEKAYLRRERRLYEETRAKCQELWAREQELVKAKVSPQEILEKLHKAAISLVTEAMAEMPDSLLLKGLLVEAEIKYRASAEVLEAKATADHTTDYKRLWDDLHKWLNEEEKGPDYLITWADERGQPVEPMTITRAIQEAEVVAANFARNKANEYLNAAKKSMEEHNPRAAHEALEKRRKLFMLPEREDKILELYDVEMIAPELKKLGAAEELLQKARLSDDPLAGWQDVNQAIAVYKWVGGVDETRRVLAERILARADGLLADGEALLEASRGATAEAEMRRHLQAAREKFQQAQGQAEKVRDYANESRQEKLRSRSANLLKKCQERLKECDREADLLRALDEAAGKLQKMLDEKDLKNALREWKSLKELYGEPTLERFSRLRALRGQMESAQGIKSVLDRLEAAFEDPGRVKSAFEECEALLQKPEYEKYEDQLRALQRKLQGRLNYLTALETLEKTGDAAEALKYLEQVARLKEHPDKEGALAEIEKIRKRKEEEAHIEQALAEARDLLKAHPRQAYQRLSVYAEKTSLRKKEINDLLKQAREAWQAGVVRELEEALAGRHPDPEGLRSLAKELEDLPPPPPPRALLGRALGQAAALEARAHAQAGRWAQAVEAWDEAIRQDGYNHPEYEQERKNARLRQVEMELGLAKGEKEASAWLDILKAEFPSAPQTWEMEAQFYHRLASKAETPASERVRLYDAARRAIGLGRDGLVNVADRQQARVVAGRLDDLENKILAEETLARSMVQVEDMLKPERSQESFQDAVRKVQELRKQHHQSAGLEDWWRETRSRVIAALEQIDNGLTEEQLWERFDAQSKMLILDPGHARAQEFLRNLPNRAMQLEGEIRRAIDDRMGLSARGPEERVLENQENDLLSLRGRAQAVYDMLGQRAQGDSGAVNLRSALAAALGDLQTFLSELNNLRQWKTLAGHHLSQAQVDDNWTNFDRLMSEINRAGFGEHRSIRDLRAKRNAIEDRKKRLLVFRQELLALVEDPDGRQVDLALRKMEIFETDPNEGDPGDDYGLRATFQARDPFSGRSLAGWFAVKRWLQSQKSQQTDLIRWLTQCGLSEVVREMQLPPSTRNPDTPKGIASWPEIERSTRQMLDEGRYKEALSRVQNALEGEMGGKESQHTPWADSQAKLLAWNTAIERLSNPPLGREQAMSRIAFQLLEQGEEHLHRIETWMAEARKRQAEIERQWNKWKMAENELNQAFLELQQADSAWWSIGKKQRILELRQRVQKALLDCRAIAPRHPTLTDIESHPLLTG